VEAKHPWLIYANGMQTENWVQNAIEEVNTFFVKLSEFDYVPSYYFKYQGCIPSVIINKITELLRALSLVDCCV